jgi:hypothetical protein
VDDPLLVGVLDALRDLEKQLEPLANAESVAVAVGHQVLALDVLHDEVRFAVRGGAGVEDAGDVGVVHEAQHPALGIEAGCQGAGWAKPTANHLDGHQPVDGIPLAGEIHGAHSP